MRSWPIDAQGSAGPTADAVLAGIIEAVGAPNFAAQALTQLNRLLQAGSWSVYRIGSGRAPVMYLSGSYRRRDTTVYCWRAYRAGLYRRDATFDGAGMQARRHGATLCHVTASEIPQREHRDRIYRRFGVLDRLSIVAPQPDDTLLAINLYRHQQQGHFSDREFATLEQVARGVLAAVSRHIALTGHPAAGTARPSTRHCAPVSNAPIRRSAGAKPTSAHGFSAG